MVSHYLLEKMYGTGVTQAYFIIRKGKWDIPNYYGDGKLLNLHLAYLIMNKPYGVPYTLDQAYHFIKSKIVIFGFPDILFYPADAYNVLLGALNKSKADIVLGLFPVDEPEKWDMAEINSKGIIRSIKIKSLGSTLKYAWIIGAWNPSFTKFMHQWLENLDNNAENEVAVGTVIQEGINQGLKVYGKVFPDGFCIDIGTVEGLQKAFKEFT